MKMRVSTVLWSRTNDDAPYILRVSVVVPAGMNTSMCDVALTRY